MPTIVSRFLCILLGPSPIIAWHHPLHPLVAAAQSRQSTPLPPGATKPHGTTALGTAFSAMAAVRYGLCYNWGNCLLSCPAALTLRDHHSEGVTAPMPEPAAFFSYVHF